MKTPTIQEVVTPSGIRGFRYGFQDPLPQAPRSTFAAPLTPYGQARAQAIRDDLAQGKAVPFTEAVAAILDESQPAIISTRKEAAQQVGNSFLRAIRWLCS